MRVVISENELSELGWSSIVLDTSGIPRTKCNYARGWVHGNKSPLTNKELADGRPMLVLYDAGNPLSSLRAVEDVLELLGDPADERWADLVPFHDFAVCWNRRHLEEDRFDT